MVIDYTYSVGKRSDSCLVYTADKQLFKVKRNEGDAKKYVCYYTKNKCTAKITVQDGICVYDKNYLTHSHHEDQESDYKTFNVKHKIKERCRSDQSIPLIKIFEEECASVYDCPDLTFDKLKSTMISNRKKHLPRNPVTADVVETYISNAIVENLIKNVEASLSYEYVKHEEYAYLIFESKSILESLPEERFFNITCTMRVVPDGFFICLLTISVVKKNIAYPCIFVLMSDRSEAAYESVFRRLEEKWHLDATTAWMDFERALRSSICNIYPNITTKCHYYQFCLAVRAKAKIIEGFYERSYVDDEVKIFFHKFLCLSIVSPDKAKNAFEYLKECALAFEIFNELVLFFEKVFIKREGVNNFCFDWAMHGKPASSNYNAELKKKFTNPDSKCSFLNFLKILKEESEQSTKEYFETNDNKKIIRIRQVNLLEKQYTLLCNGSIDIRLFLKQLTFNDNNGFVGNLNHYDIGDDHEFERNNEEDRNGLIDINMEQQQQSQPQQQSIPDVSSESACVICLLRPKTTMLVPCNHLKFCNECIDELSRPREDEYGIAIISTCPICRGVYTGSIQPYLLSKTDVAKSVRKKSIH